MTKNQILQQVLSEEIADAIYVSSIHIMNSEDNVHIINYKNSNDEQLKIVIPDYKIQRITVQDTALTVNVLKMVLKEEIPESNYLEYVYTYSLKKYTVFYSSPETKEASIAITLDEFGDHLKRYNESVVIEESSEEFTIKDALIQLLNDENSNKNVAYIRHEFTENIDEDNFYTVYYLFDSEEEQFVNFDELQVKDLMYESLKVIEEEIEEELSEDAKVYFSQIDAGNEANVPPRALPFKGKPGIRPKNDKIFNNDWNNVEMDYGNNVTIDEGFSFKYFSTDSEHHDYKKINDEIYSIARELPSLEHIMPKENEKIKVSKREADKLFLEIRKILEGKYPEIFIFTNVCDFLDTSYNSIYEKLPSKLKEVLVRELDEKYDVLKKKGLKKLF